jgi:arginyl-tRNA synthetase
VGKAATELRGDGMVDVPRLERPPKPDFGDYSTNAALLLAPALGEQPRVIAERLGDALGSRLGPAVDKVEIAGPGFLNLFMADAWYLASVAGLVATGGDYGHGEPEVRERINVEFVSANPTGPITVASGRHAAYGDALSRIIEFAGHEVEREYYVNDHGSQVRRFGESIRARARGEEPPGDGYRGPYVADLAARIEGAADADVDELALRGVELMLEDVRATLERFRVSIDRFFSEWSLHEAGEIDEVIGLLEEREHVYPLDEAVWMRTTSFGDDKDRVLMRSSGEFTYFASDIAYHRDKITRGAERMIVPLGADHHGYVPRMRAALAALGFEPERYEAPIMQLVSIVEGGERARMSKRKGEFVALDELVDDIGVDATRYFMVQRSHDTTFDLDLELARKQSQDNPVYYVQYAHARIASILRKAEAEGVAAGEAEIASAAAADDALAAAAEPTERALIRRLLELPGEAATAAERRAPHRMCAYATATAADFHAFYRDCRVVGAEPATERARLALCVAAKRTIATALALIGVSGPESM